MKIEKILEAAKETALMALVPPEITVITRDRSGHIQLWWFEGLMTPNQNKLAQKAYDLLYITNAGHWLVPPGSKVKSVSLGHDTTTGFPMCRKYNVIESRVSTALADMDERTFASSTFVSGILKQIFDGTYKKQHDIQPADLITSVVGDQFTIKTFYKVDGLDFDDLKKAQEHVKGAKLFDLILKAEPDADFLNYQAAIETFLKNSDKVISILKGQ